MERGHRDILFTPLGKGAGSCTQHGCDRPGHAELTYEHYHRGRWKRAGKRVRCQRHLKRFMEKHA